MNGSVGFQDLFVVDAERNLRRTAGALAEADGAGRAFFSWLLGEDALSAITEEVLSAWRQAAGDGGAYTYRQIMALGICAAHAPGNIELVSAFHKGVGRVIGSSFDLEGTPVGLAADAAAVLAIAHAVDRVGDHALRSAMADWLTRLTNAFGQRFLAWEVAALAVARWLLGGLPPEESAESAMVRAAIGRLSVPSKDDVRGVLALCVEGAATSTGELAAMMASALGHLRRTMLVSINVNACSVQDVVRLLRGMPTALQEWTWEDAPRTKGATPRKWHVDNEYHVQSLLWTVLAPIFPDLKREEFGVQVGSLQPRVDLVVPSLHLVIEVKFMRRDKTLKEAIRQIAEDAGLYFAKGSTYEQMIAFVWDDGQRSEDHHMLTSGIESLPRVAGAVVIGRPGKMMSAASDAGNASGGETGA